FVLIGGLNEWLPWEMPLLLQMLFGAAIVTALELLTGCVVNLWRGWAVWDYSNEWGNLWGQVCPRFSALWFLVSGGVIPLDDWLRWRWYGEERPRYRLV
ncbi:putative ABC transporter permease, partial [Faecalicatena sp. BF-R-105]|nr:putative ABC transporter permease [Faecalicatena sp. BF-R-105]